MATGIADLDALLPMGGLPKGKLTEIRGQRSAGVTTVLRQIIAAVSQKGLVAYVDAGRTLGAGEWIGEDRREERGKRETGNGKRPRIESPVSHFPFPVSRHLWFIRPPRPTDAPWCADVLLRSGAFALVVLDGGPPLSRSTGARLIRLARETGTALVVAGETGRGSGVVGAAVRVVVGKREPGIGNRRGGTRGKKGSGDSRFGNGARSRSSRQADRASHANSAAPDAHSPIPTPRLVITIEKGGIRRGIEVEYAIGLEDRLCAHPEVGDRRGAPAGNGKRETGNGLADGDAGVGFIGIGAESEFGRAAGRGTRDARRGGESTSIIERGSPDDSGIGDPASRVAHRASRVAAPLGSPPHRPRLRRRPRQAGVAGGDADGDPRGDDGDGGPRVVRGARGAAVG